ncbi:MAG: hypothetical protein J6S92_11750, partial [Oscillospiraceae bacterium]|nr:hypothetical protein [Oscillospiraceae bacterium]
ARFYYGAYYMPELSLTEFASSSDDDSINLAHYGQKGLFFYYLYEQYGKETIRRLCQAAENRQRLILNCKITVLIMKRVRYCVQ